MYLLDTHALVWAVTAPEELPARVREILAGGEVIASVVSYWELVLKKGRETAPVLQPMAWRPVRRAGDMGMKSATAWAGVTLALAISPER